MPIDIGQPLDTSVTNFKPASLGQPEPDRHQQMIEEYQSSVKSAKNMMMIGNVMAMTGNDEFGKAMIGIGNSMMKNDPIKAMTEAVGVLDKIKSAGGDVDHAAELFYKSGALPKGYYKQAAPTSTANFKYKDANGFEINYTEPGLKNAQNPTIPQGATSVTADRKTHDEEYEEGGKVWKRLVYSDDLTDAKDKNGKKIKPIFVRNVKATEHTGEKSIDRQHRLDREAASDFRQAKMDANKAGEELRKWQISDEGKKKDAVIPEDLINSNREAYQNLIGNETYIREQKSMNSKTKTVSKTGKLWKALVNATGDEETALKMLNQTYGLKLGK